METTQDDISGWTQISFCLLHLRLLLFSWKPY